MCKPSLQNHCRKGLSQKNLAYATHETFVAKELSQKSLKQKSACLVILERVSQTLSQSPPSFATLISPPRKGEICRKGFDTKKPQKILAKADLRNTGKSLASMARETTAFLTFFLSRRKIMELHLAGPFPALPAGHP